MKVRVLWSSSNGQGQISTKPWRESSQCSSKHGIRNPNRRGWIGFYYFWEVMFGMFLFSHFSKRLGNRYFLSLCNPVFQESGLTSPLIIYGLIYVFIILYISLIERLMHSWITKEDAKVTRQIPDHRMCRGNRWSDKESCGKWVSCSSPTKNLRGLVVADLSYLFAWI